ncbi:MAG TPA: V-type ATPase 116kDa subunit family protein [Rectinemataceae bacterium]|nr:V-type ATPase 116kDa subunit family protein [Rectinemataceae bacterium]
MKKFLLVLMEKDARAAPLYLRKLGIVHLERFQSLGESCATLDTALKSALNAKGILTSSRDKKNKAKPDASVQVMELIVSTLEGQAAISSLLERISELKRETDRIRNWGDFTPELFEKLREYGLQIRLLEGQPQQLAEIAEEVDYVRLSAPKGKVRIALLDAAPTPVGFEEFRLPALPLSRLDREISECEKSVAEKKAELRRLSTNVATIDAEIRRIESTLTIERLRAGMPRQDALRYLAGYVPAKVADSLMAEAGRRGWAIALDDPADDELPPTKVENNAVVRMIQPVLDFMGTVPNYREYDTSLWFLGFFSLYFAMIFGDGGYGLILLGIAIAMFTKSRKAKKPLSDAGRLLFVLSGMTILWGFLTGTWFAIPYESLPGILQNMSLTALNGSNPDSGTNTKIFCFIIGTLQLSIAHIKNIKRDWPNIKFLAQVGSLCMVVGMLNAVLNLVIDASRFPLQGWALALVGGGFILNFIFGNWDGSLLRALLAGLKGIIPSFLGVVSVFADIVSYIRLWAVGLAGLAISQTVNGMAINLLGPTGGSIVAFLIGGLVGLVLLFVGHGINLVMSVLSVLVHGIRLNILEFSSHLGMEWSGYKYEPLSESAEERKAQENII